MNIPGFAAQAGEPQRVRFHGSGSEYFRIWIVNLALSVATLGIYSAWAKVRGNRYLYGATELAGASFEYHGNPLAILKGRLLMLVLGGLYAYGAHSSPLLAGIVFLVLLAASPWLVWSSLRFKLHNTGYRGMRFAFVGDLADAYKAYLLRPMLNGVTFGLATPFIHQRAKQYQIDHARFGLARFSFSGEAGSFYLVYAGFLVVGVAGAALAFMAAVSGGLPDGAEGAAAQAEFRSGLFVLGVYGWIFLLYPLLLQVIHNLVWNHVALDQHHFTSDMKLGRTLYIGLTNYLAIVCTLGLFLPFARIRTLRYRLEALTLHPHGSLDDFVAAGSAEVAALGEGAADFMDVDLSL